MPIYAYKCDSCGFAKDVLQKMSDAPLTQCPSCDAATFKKQLTAAGFQLKGSGWYATDFKNGNNAAPAKPDGQSGDAPAAKSETTADSKSTAKSESKTSESKTSESKTSETKPSESKPSVTPAKKPQSTPATGSGS
jgi:putative FmdB family regulatory protein